MLRVFSKAAAAASLVVMLVATGDAANLTPAFSPANGISSSGSVGINVGVSSAVNFTPRSDLLVEAIGTYDADLDGLTTPWEVAIYAVEPREQLRVAMVPAEETESIRVGGFRYVPILPLRLSAGVVYQIATYNFGKEGVRSGVPGEMRFSIGAAADIEVIGAFRHDKINLGHVSFAEYAFGVYRFGGGFLYRTIPEPTALALAAMIALCGMMGRRCTRG
jgi:hypothetical protein